MTDATGLHLGFDWSVAPPPPKPFAARIVDTTLGEWLHGTPNAKLDDRCLALLHCTASIGVVHIGLGRLEARPPELLGKLVREVARTKAEMQVVCPCELLATLLPSADGLSAQSGRPLELGVEFASPRLRAKTDGWQLHEFLDYVQTGVDAAVSAGFSVNCIIEDAAQTAPDVLAALLLVAAEAGVSRITLSDRRGNAAPAAVAGLIPFARSVLLARRFAHVPVEWDGYSVKGVAVENALVALSGGAERVVAAALGAGQQGASRAPVESIVLQDFSTTSGDNLLRVRQYAQAASKLLRLGTQATQRAAKPPQPSGLAAN
jgi:hypothetical protein